MAKATESGNRLLFEIVSLRIVMQLEQCEQGWPSNGGKEFDDDNVPNAEHKPRLSMLTEENLKRVFDEKKSGAVMVDEIGSC